MGEQRMIRPAEAFVHGLDGPVAILDGRVCAELNRLLGLAEVRARVRGRDPVLDRALLSMHLAALAAGSCAGATNPAPTSQPMPASNHDSTVGPSAAATIIGITPSGVRKAIAEKRLPAELVDGRWRIARDDLAAYPAARKETHHGRTR
jgi:hypothetical protein